MTPEPKLPGPEGPEEDAAGATPRALRGLAATLGKLLVEHWPAAQQDPDVRWTLVALAELANALLGGDEERAAWLLDELEKAATR